MASAAEASSQMTTTRLFNSVWSVKVCMRIDFVRTRKIGTGRACSTLLRSKTQIECVIGAAEYALINLPRESSANTTLRTAVCRLETSARDLTFATTGH